VRSDLTYGVVPAWGWDPEASVFPTEGSNRAPLDGAVLFLLGLHALLPDPLRRTVHANVLK